MKIRYAMIPLFCLCASLDAKDRENFVEGIGFDISTDGGSILFWPHNEALKKDPGDGPFFIMIEIASSLEGLEEQSTVATITQGIPLELEAPYPIGVKMGKGETNVFKVTIFSDACFSGWRRSQIFSINSEGILPLEPTEREQGGADQGAASPNPEVDGGVKIEPRSEPLDQ